MRVRHPPPLSMAAHNTISIISQGIGRKPQLRIHIPQSDMQAPTRLVPFPCHIHVLCKRLGVVAARCTPGLPIAQATPGNLKQEVGIGLQVAARHVSVYAATICPATNRTGSSRTRSWRCAVKHTSAPSRPAIAHPSSNLPASRKQQRPIRAESANTCRPSVQHPRRKETPCTR